MEAIQNVESTISKRDKKCIIENCTFTQIIFLTKHKVPRKCIPHHVYLYLLGHCFYKPGERSICVSLGERHDR